MKNICVITGGGSGMGLAAAKLLGKDHSIILAGRTVSKLDGAVSELKGLGIDVSAYPCDVSDRTSVQALAKKAAAAGAVKTVIHAAGISPHMADAASIFRVNAIGTIFVNEEFLKVMEPGACIVDVASMAAYMMPEGFATDFYSMALSDIDKFRQTSLAVLESVPEDASRGFSYVLSKNFAVWYAAECACLAGSRGIRVLSVSPGTFKTPLGEIEGKDASSIAESGALGRVGEVAEIAGLLAFVAGSQAAYLTGTDILCDGGTVAMLNRNKREAAAK
ncbi:MAG: SDR family oxidoreductase [Clostridiales bacterium]|jgi:NAD(P)-dependent dehydrogenase (short-subunit alcohol dehydrogenase family)|nr:SDR family oxidoreductase [Clostridiales bacterium]